MEGKQNENQETNLETEEKEQGYKVYSCSYLILSIVRLYEELQGGCSVKRRIHIMKLRCCSLENSVLVVMFTPRRFKNPRKKGSITTKRVRSAMEAFIQLDEKIRTELAQGVDFMCGIDDIFRL